MIVTANVSWLWKMEGPMGNEKMSTLLGNKKEFLKNLDEGIS